MHLPVDKSNDLPLPLKSAWCQAVPGRFTHRKLTSSNGKETSCKHGVDDMQMPSSSYAELAVGIIPLVSFQLISTSHGACELA